MVPFYSLQVPLTSSQRLKNIVIDWSSSWTTVLRGRASKGTEVQAYMIMVSLYIYFIPRGSREQRWNWLKEGLTKSSTLFWTERKQGDLKQLVWKNEQGCT